MTLGNLVALAVPLVVGGRCCRWLLRGADVCDAAWRGDAAVRRDCRDRSVRGVARRHARPAPERVRRARRDERPARGGRGRIGDWRAEPVRPAATARICRASRGSMRGRNVVLVVLESTGARHLGLYGGVPDPAPNLTALAARSIVFERAYAVYPESIKGLFATLCSRYPAFDTAPEIYAGVPCASLPRTLARPGYRTALFHSGRFMYLGMTSVIERRGFDVLEDAGGDRRQRRFELRRGRRVDGRAGACAGSTRSIDASRSSSPTCRSSGHNPYVTSRPRSVHERPGLLALHERAARRGRCARRAR